MLPVLAASAMNDWLQSGFTKLCASSNVSQREANAPAFEAGDVAAKAADETASRFLRES